MFWTSENDLTDTFWEVRAPRHVFDPASFSRDLPRAIVIMAVTVVCVLGAIGFIAGGYPSLSLETGYLEWPPGFG